MIENRANAQDEKSCVFALFLFAKFFFIVDFYLISSLKGFISFEL